MPRKMALSLLRLILLRFLDRSMAYPFKKIGKKIKTETAVKAGSKPNADQAAYDERGKRKKKPTKRKSGADLSEKIEGLIGITPNGKPPIQIDDASHGKFDARNGKATEKSAKYQRFPMKTAIDPVEK